MTRPHILLRAVVVTLGSLILVFAATLFVSLHTYQNRLEEESYTMQIGKATYEKRLIADEYMLYGTPRAKEEWLVKHTQIDSLIEAEKKVPASHLDPVREEALQTARAQSKEIFTQLVSLREAATSTSAVFLTANLDRLNSQLTERAQQVITIVSSVQADAAEGAAQALSSIIRLFVAEAMLFLVLLGGSYYIIRQNLEKLAKVDQMKSDFVSLVSHQLKTPVAQIRGFVDNMKDGLTGPLTDKQAEYLNDMSQVAAKNTKLIDDLLNVSRLERGMLKLNPEPLDMHDLLDDVVSPLRDVAKKKGVELVEHLPTQGIKIMGDAVKTREAVRNFIDNAIKFTEPAKHVTVSGEDGAGFATITVADEGTGIDPDVQTELFQKNRVWSGKVKASGAGLGLFLAKQFIELSGGSISFTTAAGKGTTFVVKLKKA